MIPVITVIVGFILTGLVGNRLLQHWQLMSWRRQQNFLGHEREYVAVRDLADQLSNAMGKRLYHMKRLRASIGNMEISEVEDRLKVYDDVVVSWNECLNSYYVKLKIHASVDYAYRLEREVQEAFSSAGADLEILIRRKRIGNSVPKDLLKSLDFRLNTIQGVIGDYSRDLTRKVDDMRKRIYFGEKITYVESELAQFSTWELFKALFVSSVDGHAVVRTALNSRFPN